MCRGVKKKRGRFQKVNCGLWREDHTGSDKKKENENEKFILEKNAHESAR